MSTVQPRKGEVIPEKIFIKDIKITNAQVNSVSDFDTSSDETEFDLSLTTKTLFNEEKGCRIIFEVDISKINENQVTLASATFTIKFDFQIENLDTFLNYSEDKTSMTADAEIGIALMGIAYSTARGILLSRTAGTVLEGIILPVIDPAVLLKETNK